MDGRSLNAKLSRVLPLVAVAAAAVLLPACGGHDMAHSTSGKGNAEDSMFVTRMVPHHEGAIEMAKLAETRAQRPEVKAFAATILSSQAAEIARMKEMKKGMGAAGDHGDGHSSGAMSDHEMGMDGDMGSLTKSGQFDRDFLKMMIPHHEGAIRMSRQVIERGSDPQVKQLARSIVTSQQAEIDQMKRWLKDWYGQA